MEEFIDDLVARSLERATLALERWIEEQLGDLGVTRMEARVLAYLGEVGECSINDIHRACGHKRSTLTALLDRLERRGWIERGSDARSRRLVRVRLLDAGRDAATRARASLRRLDEVVAGKTAGDDLHGFLRVLHALEEAIRE